jgi:O-antigen/teichoic acid export membrane protein
VNDSAGTATTTEPAAKQENVAQRAGRGSLVQIGGQLISQLLRLGSNLIMTHLLVPDAFGLVAIVQSVMLGLQLVSDVGVWQSIVRSKRGDDPDFLNTCFSLHALRGVLLFFGGCAFAIPAAYFYERSEFLLLLPAASVQVLLAGLESTKIASSHRHLHLGKVTALEIVAQVVTLAFSIPLAIAWKSAWALVVAALISALIRTVLSHVWLDGPPNKFRWERATITEVLQFGRWAFVSTALFFLCMRWDQFALAKFEGMALAGVFGIAVMIVSVPGNIGDRLSGFVLTPVLAHSYRENPSEFDQALRRALRASLPATAVLYLGAAMTAPAFFHLAYRELYWDAGWMTQLLLVGAWMVYVGDSGTRALLAVGDPRSMAQANLVRLIATIAATIIGYSTYDFMGFVVGGMVGTFAGAVASMLVLRKHNLHIADVCAKVSALVYAIGIIGCAAPLWIERQTGWPSEYVTLIGVPVLLGPFAFVALKRARATIRAGV